MNFELSNNKDNIKYNGNRLNFRIIFLHQGIHFQLVQARVKYIYGEDYKLKVWIKNLYQILFKLMLVIIRNYIDSCKMKKIPL